MLATFVAFASNFRRHGPSPPPLRPTERVEGVSLADIRAAGAAPALFLR